MLSATDGAPVELTARPGSETDRLARQLMARELERARAGCSMVSFRYTGDRWIRIMDTVGGTVRIAASHHRGMPDLIVGERNRLMWDGIKRI